MKCYKLVLDSSSYRSFCRFRGENRKEPLATPVVWVSSGSARIGWNDYDFELGGAERFRETTAPSQTNAATTMLMTCKKMLGVCAV